jgi:Phage gp6-like head-tail connector protein
MGANLVTLAEYKAYAGITSTNQDAEINSIIPKASQLVKSICRRTFIDYVNDSKEEVFSGGWNKLFLKE